MAKRVLWLCAPHRSMSNAIAGVLYAAGLDDTRLIKQNLSSPWNKTVWDDSWILAYNGHTCGTDDLSIGQPRPEVIEEASKEIVYPSSNMGQSPHEILMNEFRPYLVGGRKHACFNGERGRFDECKTDYLLKTNTPGPYKLLLDAFPAETTHVMVWPQRNIDARSKSLSSRSGKPLELCRSFQERSEKACAEMANDFLKRRYKLVTVDVDRCIIDPPLVLAEMLLELGIEVTSEALAMWDTKEVRF